MKRTWKTRNVMNQGRGTLSKSMTADFTVDSRTGGLYSILLSREESLNGLKYYWPLYRMASHFGLQTFPQTVTSLANTPVRKSHIGVHIPIGLRRKERCDADFPDGNEKVFKDPSQSRTC
jgi:hypothetical protein